MADCPCRWPVAVLPRLAGSDPRGSRFPGSHISPFPYCPLLAREHPTRPERPAQVGDLPMPDHARNPGPAPPKRRRCDAGVVRFAARDVDGLVLAGDMYGRPLRFA